MEKILLSYFDQKKQEAVLNVVREKSGPNFHESIFPRKQTADLKWDALDASITNVAAAVQEFGTSASKFKRDTINQRSGKINPIEIKYELDELLMLNYLNPAYRNVVLEAVFEDTLNAYNAVRARMDFIAMQQLSTGKVTYSTDNNPDGVIGILVDYSLASSQSSDVGTTWATAATATPLIDIRTVLATLEAEGKYPDVIRMTKTIFNYMVATTEVLTTFAITVTKDGIQSKWVSVAEMNVFLDQKGMPPIHIIRDDVSYKKADGTFDNTRRGWAEGIVQFGYNVEGRSHWVEPLESSQKSITPALVTLKNGIAIQQYSELDPPSVLTKGKGIMYPVWNKSASVHLLDATP